MMFEIKERITKVLGLWKNKKVKIFTLIILVIGLICSGLILKINGEENIVNSDIVIQEKTEDKVYVEVRGEINNPGIYTIDKSLRVSDAIRIAGGISTNGSLEYINLTMEVNDGLKVYIPNKKDVKTKEEKIDKTNQTIISLNTCSNNDIENFLTPYLGSQKVKAIVQYREEKGGFTNINDIINVTGMTESVYSKVKEFIIL